MFDFFSFLTMIGGLALFLYGMNVMGDGLAKLAGGKLERILEKLTANPIMGVFLGFVVTAVIQSSSASVGILQAMSMNGLITFGTAFPIIMGQNIGTCVTALLSAIGASKNGKRTAFVHLYFNLIGTVIFMIAFYSINAFVDFAFMDESISGTGIATLHSIFNVSATLILLPCRKLLEKLACLTVRDKEVDKVDEKSEIQLLDYRFLDKPSFAVEQC